MLLVPCSSCRRHVRARERVCPFCSAARVLVVGAALVACHASPTSNDPRTVADRGSPSATSADTVMYGGPPLPPDMLAPPPPSAAPPDAGPLDMDGGAPTMTADSVRAWHDRTYFCVTEGQQRGRNTRGTLVVSVDVGADGKAIRASITKNTGLTLEVAECLASAAGHLVFTPPAGGSATVVLPLELGGPR